MGKEWAVQRSPLGMLGCRANPLGLRKAVTHTALRGTQANLAKPHHVTCAFQCQEPFVKKGMDGLLMTTPKFSLTQVSIFTLMSILII